MRPKRDKKTGRWKATRGTTITKKWDAFFDEEGGESVEFP